MPKVSRRWARSTEPTAANQIDAAMSRMIWECDRNGLKRGPDRIVAFLKRRAGGLRGRKPSAGHELPEVVSWHLDSLIADYGIELVLTAASKLHRGRGRPRRRIPTLNTTADVIDMLAAAHHAKGSACPFGDAVSEYVTLLRQEGRVIDRSTAIAEYRRAAREDFSRRDSRMAEDFGKTIQHYLRAGLPRERAEELALFDIAASYDKEPHAAKLALDRAKKLGERRRNWASGRSHS